MANKLFANKPCDWDLIVLGGGAAGLFAAIRASELGKRVLLIEKNRRPGVKILMSGGTRCNLTNARGLRSLRVVSGSIDAGYDSSQARGARSIQEAFGDGGAFLGPALKALSVDQTVAMFEAEGLPTKVEANGKIFPASDRAVNVLDALLRRLGRSGAMLRCNAPVQSVEPLENGFRVSIPGEKITASRVIVAVGGKSFPGCGTTGDGYALARRFGHTIVEPKPALVPIKVEPDWVPSLSGLTLPDIIASVLAPGGQKLIQRREALLFAHFGLTGPAILDVSRASARYQGEGRPVLAIDLLPDVHAEMLDRQLQETSRIGRSTDRQLAPTEHPETARRTPSGLGQRSGRSDGSRPLTRGAAPARAGRKGTATADSGYAGVCESRGDEWGSCPRRSRPQDARKSQTARTLLRR